MKIGAVCWMLLVVDVYGRRKSKKVEVWSQEEVDNRLPEFPNPVPSHRFFYARDSVLSNKENEFEVETNSRLVDITADKALIDKLLTRLDSNGPYPDWQEIEEEMIRLENDPNNHEFRDEGRHGNGETIPTPPTLNTTLIELQSSLPPTTVPFETPPTLPFLLQTTTSSLSETVPTATTVPFNAFDWTTEINIDRSDEITQADSTETLTSQMIDRLVTAMTSGASIKVTVNNSTASAIQGRIDRNYTTHLNRNDDVDITTTVRAYGTNEGTIISTTNMPTATIVFTTANAIVFPVSNGTKEQYAISNDVDIDTNNVKENIASSSATITPTSTTVSSPNYKVLEIEDNLITEYSSSTRSGLDYFTVVITIIFVRVL